MEEPITDIAIIDADELSEPPGFLLLEKVLNGSLPANLNQGTEGKNMYLTYRRVCTCACFPVVDHCSLMRIFVGSQKATYYCVGCDLPCFG